LYVQSHSKLLLNIYRNTLAWQTEVKVASNKLHVQHRLWTQNMSVYYEEEKVKGKAVPVTEREGPKGCKTSRLLHFVWTIGSKMAVRSALRAGGPLPPRKIPGTHFR
jgi:hypothetical protein